MLCLKGGKCARPCSLCDVHVSKASSAEALSAKERDVVAALQREYEVAVSRQKSQKRPRRVALQAVDSSNGYMPALACLAGISTAPYMLFRMVGFDILHVRHCSIIAVFTW